MTHAVDEFGRALFILFTAYDCVGLKEVKNLEMPLSMLGLVETPLQGRFRNGLRFSDFLVSACHVTFSKSLSTENDNIYQKISHHSNAKTRVVPWTEWRNFIKRIVSISLSANMKLMITELETGHNKDFLLQKAVPTSTAQYVQLLEVHRGQ